MAARSTDVRSLNQGPRLCTFADFVRRYDKVYDPVANAEALMQKEQRAARNKALNALFARKK